MDHDTATPSADAIASVPLETDTRQPWIKSTSAYVLGLLLLATIFFPSYYVPRSTGLLGDVGEISTTFPGVERLLHLDKPSAEEEWSPWHNEIEHFFLGEAVLGGYGAPVALAILGGLAMLLLSFRRNASLAIAIVGLSLGSIVLFQQMGRWTTVLGSGFPGGGTGTDAAVIWLIIGLQLAGTGLLAGGMIRDSHCRTVLFLGAGVALLLGIHLPWAVLGPTTPVYWSMLTEEADGTVVLHVCLRGMQIACIIGALMRSNSAYRTLGLLVVLAAATFPVMVFNFMDLPEGYALWATLATIFGVAKSIAILGLLPVGLLHLLKLTTPATPEPKDS
jgi:hypothetical protein